MEVISLTTGHGLRDMGTGIVLPNVYMIVKRGNGYETRQTSEGMTKEQTLMWSRASTLNNLLFYAHSFSIIDQTQTFSLTHCPICAAGVTVGKSEKEIE